MHRFQRVSNSSVSRIGSISPWAIKLKTPASFVSEDSGETGGCIHCFVKLSLVAQQSYSMIVGPTVEWFPLSFE
jgi:hypothetical protein